MVELFFTAFDIFSSSSTSCSNSEVLKDSLDNNSIDWFTYSQTSCSLSEQEMNDTNIKLKTGLEKTYKWIFDQLKSGDNTSKFIKS